MKPIATIATEIMEAVGHASTLFSGKGGVFDTATATAISAHLLRLFLAGESDAIEAAAQKAKRVDPPWDGKVSAGFYDQIEHEIRTLKRGGSR